MTRAALYARTSTSGKGQDPELQLEDLRRPDAPEVDEQASEQGTRSRLRDYRIADLPASQARSHNRRALVSS